VSEVTHQCDHGQRADELVHPLVGDHCEGRGVVEQVVVLVNIPVVSR
jgi:hypothetical protein